MSIPSAVLVTSAKATEAFFEISPVYKAKSAPLERTSNQDEADKIVLVLKPFAAKPRMVFKDVLVGAKVSQTFSIQNPDPCELTVDIVLPSTTLQLQQNRVQMPPKSTIDLELTWCPSEKGCFTESIQVKDSKGRRGAISLSMTAVTKAPLKAKRFKVAKAAAPVAMKAPVKQKPAWVDPLPAKREVLKPVTPQKAKMWIANNIQSIPMKEEVDAPLRRETFLVVGKENDGSPALPRTPAHDISNDSLDAATPVVAKTLKRNFAVKACDLLKEFTLSPLVRPSMVGKPVKEDKPLDPSLSLLEDGATPSFGTRRCSTTFKERPSEVLKKEKGVSPRELFGQPMLAGEDLPDECRLSSATYVADKRLSTDTYVADKRLSTDTYVADKRLSTDTYVADKRASSDTFVADKRASTDTFVVDRRASNETYTAEQRLSTDTFVFSNSLSFEGASGDLNPAPSPGPRTFTPMLPDLEEEPPQPVAWNLNETERVEFEREDVQVLPEDDMSGIEFQMSGIDNQSNTDIVTRSTRKRCAMLLEMIDFTPIKKKENDDDVVAPRYNLRSAGKTVCVQEVQTVSTFTMDISPPKKFKLPSLSSTERITSSAVSKSKDKEVDKTFVLTAAGSSMYIPFGKKKLKLVPEPEKTAAEQANADAADEALMDYAMSQMSAPGLLEDPFYMNPMLTDAIIAKYEMDFNKWLNSVLTPPEELESVDLVKVNAAELWARSTQSRAELSLAPSKELVSFRYLSVKSRLDQLRHAAIALFSRDEIKSVLCCVNSKVDSGNIKIRADKILHLDQGLKNGLLGLFMSYNPLWLRIGLETVCGTLIPMKSNTDLAALSYFLVNRVLSPESIVGKSHLLLKEECRQKFNKYVTKKFLMLVFFLDKAKNSRLIRHDPCLFLKNSAVKTSKEMLLSFSRLLLAGEGDITKHLGYMKYKVSHEQGYLHEFNYSVKHLGVDLRDGVRITQVVELVTGTNGLKKTLRVPAVSKLQKIHNVNVALKGLEATGFQVKNLTANDIVMGHKEKTLSLIWQIIHNFQAPRLDKAARAIQQWWLRPTLRTALHRQAMRQRFADAATTLQKLARGFLCRRRLAKQRALMEEERLKGRSVRIVQRAVRQFFLRKRVSALARLAKQHAAARTIQAAFRVYKARREMLELRTEAAIREVALRESSALKIQTFLRRALAVKKVNALRLERAEQIEAATRLQMFWRCVLARRHLGQLRLRNNSAITLQSHWRSLRVRRHLQRQHAAATLIQSSFRCFLARRQLQDLRAQYEARRLQAAIVLQSHVRGLMVRRQMRRMGQAAEVMQRAFRCHQSRQKLAALRVEQHEKMNQAALVVQSAFRGHVVRKEMRRMQTAALVIQCAFRCHLAKAVLAELVAAKIAAERNAAAVKVQCAWRCLQARKTLAQLRQEEARRRDAAAIVLQCAWRVYIARRNLAFLQRNAAALRVQCWWRQVLARKQLRLLQHEAQVQRANAAALVLQCAWRCFLARKTQARLAHEDLAKKMRAACLIQSIWRGHCARMQMCRLKAQRNKAAVMVQCAWRCYAAKRELAQLRTEDYNKKSAAACIMQSLWRGHCARVLVRKLKARRNEAAVVIQCTWRRHVAQRALARLQIEDFEKKSNAACTIQSLWRGHSARVQVRRLKTKRTVSAVVIQCYWRRFKAQRTLAQLRTEDFEKRSRAACIIQSVWRGHCARVLLKRMKAKRNKAAVTIQCTWRSYVARRVLAGLQREQFEKRCRAACVIQTTWKGYCARQLLLKLKTQRNQAAVNIQCAWRCFLARQTLARLAHEKRIGAAIVIQSVWRGHCAREILRKLKTKRSNAAVTVQCAWRCYMAKKELARLISEDFEKKTRAACSIQSVWRGHCTRKLVLALKERRRLAAVSIQTAWRCRSARRVLASLKKEELEMRNGAAVRVQGAWRMYAARKTLQHLKEQKGEKLNHAATKIAAAWRGHALRKKLAAERRQVSAVLIQSAWRRHVARKLVEKLRLQRRHKAATTIQSFARVLIARKQLRQLKQEQQLLRGAAATKLQSNVRRWLAVREAAKRRLAVQERRNRAAEVLQAAWRARCARQQLLQLQRAEAAARVLQTAWRIWLWRRALTKMQFLRRHGLVDEELLKMWQSVLLRPNAHLVMPRLLLSIINLQNSLFTEKTVAATIIQRRWRKYKSSRLQAAMKIQAVFRGYMCRKRIREAAASRRAVLLVDEQAQQKIQLDQKATSKLLEKFDQLQEASKNVREEETVGYKILYALNNWQKTYDFEIGAYTLFNKCLQSSSSFVMMVLPGVQSVVNGFMYNNRSVPAMSLSLQASEILLCVCKYPDSLPHLQKMNDLVESVTFNLFISASTNAKLFLNCCTILWVLAHDPLLRQKIVAQPDLKFKLSAIRSKVVKGKSVKGELPSLKLHKQPNTFGNKQHAFQELVKKLGMKL